MAEPPGDSREIGHRAMTVPDQLLDNRGMVLNGEDGRKVKSQPRRTGRGDSIASVAYVRRMHRGGLVKDNVGLRIEVDAVTNS